MTTREQIIAKAVECFHPYSEWQIDIEKFYAIAFEAGRAAEREETNRRPLPDNTAPYIRAREDTK